MQEETFDGESPTHESSRSVSDMDRPVVAALGASAGGVEALQVFFDAVPDDTGAAFVVIMHLDPEHTSSLHEVLQQNTTMPVVQVRERTLIEPDHIYVIPPGQELRSTDRELILSEFQEPRGQRRPIDHFFRSIAESHGDGFGIIFSGSDSDGAVGMKAIKEQGGILMVQAPEEAAFEEMPRSAIETGFVDEVFPVRELAHAFADQMHIKRRGPEEDEESILQNILTHLQVRRGHDFTQYKRSTVMRRIQRRMLVHRQEHLSEYLNFLRNRPKETTALFRELLISVTRFFRDAESWETLAERVIPKLFEGKTAEDQVRVWVPGCATGEEAYSLAMLLCEHAAAREIQPDIQIFATDLDEAALQKARDGRYVGAIEADVSSERLERFFEPAGTQYHVRQQLRERVIFASHSVLQDPPFSRLDLITCRNLLIYLEPELQQQVFDIFHYALEGTGYLFLGNAESAEASAELFRTVDRKHRIYLAYEGISERSHVPSLLPSRSKVPSPAREPYRPAAQQDTRAEPQGSEAQMHRRALEELAPPSILVDENHDILHFSETAGRYVQPPGGSPTRNITELVRAELRAALRTGLYQVFSEDKASVRGPVAVQFNGTPHPVHVAVRPAGEHEDTDRLALVIFIEDEAAEELPEQEAPENDLEARHLEQELRETRQRLQKTIEEYEASNEELRAANEELQSMNEEYRSTTEELETSREELQSVNEELQTVNSELKAKLEEVSRANSDLQNLMRATDIGVLFLDRELNIKRFTPQAQRHFNLRESDRGRPISHLTHNLNYDELEPDSLEVLRDLTVIEREVQDNKGRWYLVRLHPYRTIEDKIDGVVITFVDITERRKAEESLALALEAAKMGTWDADLTTDTARTDQRHSQIFGYEEPIEWGPEILREHMLPEDRQAFDEAFEKALETGTYDLEARVRQPDGSIRWIRDRGRVYYDDEAEPVRMAGITVDITDRREAEQARRKAEERYQLLMENVQEYAIIMMDTEGIITTWSAGAERLFGYSAEEVIGQTGTLIFTEEDRQANIPEREMDLALETGQSNNERWHVRKDGSRFWGSGMTTVLYDPEADTKDRSTLRGFVKVLRDNTRRKEAEEALHELNETLEERVQQRTQEVRELASKLTRAEQEERRRISRVLHDNLQQMLYGIQMKISFAQRQAEAQDQQQQLEHLSEADTWTRDAIETTRQLTVDLSPPILQGEGLTDSLEWLRSQMKERHNLQVELQAEDAFYVPDEDLRLLLFQSVRELLFNVVKHADTDRATVELEMAEQLIVRVIDKGEGFDPDQQRSEEAPSVGIGLFSVEERLSLFGGEMQIESSPGQGTRITLYAPLKPDHRTNEKSD